MSRPKLTPEIAFNLARRLYDASGERDERLEKMIAQSPMYASAYATSVLKGPFPEGEPLIIRYPGWACEYARDALKSPWPEAEPVIAQSVSWSGMYIRTVLKTDEDRNRFMALFV